jgi:hypothetical protein
MDGLRPQLRPLRRDRHRAHRGRLARGGAVRRLPHGGRPDARPRHDQRPRVAAADARRAAPPRPGRRPPLRDQQRSGGAPGRAGRGHRGLGGGPAARGVPRGRRGRLSRPRAAEQADRGHRPSPAHRAGQVAGDRLPGGPGARAAAAAGVPRLGLAARPHPRPRRAHRGGAGGTRVHRGGAGEHARRRRHRVTGQFPPVESVPLSLRNLDLQTAETAFSKRRMHATITV